jgi:hypothetical protein
MEETIMPATSLANVLRASIFGTTSRMPVKFEKDLNSQQHDDWYHERHDFDPVKGWVIIKTNDAQQNCCSSDSLSAALSRLSRY